MFCLYTFFPNFSITCFGLVDWLGPKSAEIIKSILGCSLIYPCLIRWNSLFDSISQLLIYKAKLNIVFQHLNTNYIFKDLERIFK